MRFGILDLANRVFGVVFDDVLVRRDRHVQLHLLLQALHRGAIIFKRRVLAVFDRLVDGAHIFAVGTGWQSFQCQFTEFLGLLRLAAADMHGHQLQEAKS